MSRLSRCLCPLTQDLNGKLQRAFRKKSTFTMRKKKKDKVPDCRYSQYGSTPSVYCTIIVIATRRFLCFANCTHTRLPFQRHCYSIYIHNNKNEFEWETDGIKKRINKNDGMTINFPWSLNSSSSDSRGFYCTILQPQRRIHFNLIDVTSFFQFSNHKKSSFDISEV